MPARYLIGIDLGTTNSAVAFVDTKAADPRVRVFEVPQLVAPGEVAPRRQLPSFIYMASEIDLAAHETALPWNQDSRQVVGELARSQGCRLVGHDHLHARHLTHGRVVHVHRHLCVLLLHF